MSTQTFNISLPKDLVQKVDDVANKEYRTRSDLIREAIRVYLREQEEWDAIFTAGKQTGAKKKIKTETDVHRIVDRYRHRE